MGMGKREADICLSFEVELFELLNGVIKKKERGTKLIKVQRSVGLMDGWERNAVGGD
jgi:hypothetical protein